MARNILALAVVLTTTILVGEDFPYHQPPKDVTEVLNAPPTPVVSVSPQHDYAIFLQPVRYPSISKVAQPMLRLAGIRIDTDTNGMHMAPNYISYSIKRLSDGADVRILISR